LRSETIRIDWVDVKRRFMASVGDGKPWRQAMQTFLLQLHREPYAVDAWRGGSGAQTLEWLRNGYFAPELQAAAELVPATERVRVGWSEEDGDIDIGRLYGGYDDYMLEVSPSDTKPGLKLTADIFFAALVDPKVVREYGAWLAGLIGALEQGGYDLEIAACTPVDALYEGSTKRSNVEINVKRPGELSDFTEWSALFAPTGLRHLCFTAFGVASEKVGKRQTSHMATSIISAWGVTYDADANHLHVSVNQRHGRGAFPIERLNEQLALCGLV
jgi:hypothetical protein